MSQNVSYWAFSKLSRLWTNPESQNSLLHVCKILQTNKLSERRWGVRTHLDEELSVLLDVLVSRLLLLFLLRLHRDVDVHPQLLTARQEQHEVNERPASRLWDSLTRVEQVSHFLYPRKSLMTVSGLKSISSTLAFSSSITWRQRDRHRKNPKHQWQKYYKITHLWHKCENESNLLLRVKWEVSGCKHIKYFMLAPSGVQNENTTFLSGVSADCFGLNFMLFTFSRI